MMKKALLLLFILNFSSSILFASNRPADDMANTIIYVDSAASLGGDGTAWISAYKYLQDAINQANSIANEINQQEIWVKKGTYFPDEDEAGIQSNNNTNSYFALHDFVYLYGGFKGTERNIGDRKLASNRSILDADLRQNGVGFGNTKHVILYPNSLFSSPSSVAAILDGFLISNSGQGNQMVLQSCYPFIQNCIFSDGNKGAVRNIDSDPTFINCLFYDNSADTAHCIFNINSSPKILNCTFSENDLYYGDNGMIVNIDSSFPTIQNCILWNNTKLEIIDDSTSLADVSYSIIDGFLLGENMEYGDPGFIDPRNYDFKIPECSNAVNNGTTYSGVLNVDINNDSRIVQGTIDIGAYENSTGRVYTIVYVDSSNMTPGGGLTWGDAFDNLQDALALSTSTSGCVQIWAAQGTYTPDQGVGFTSLDTTASFVMQNQVEIYGGFSGSETLLDERDIGTNKTILSGLLSESFQSIVIVRNIANNLNASAILDGFTVMKADSIGILNKASSPTFKNLTIIEHHFTSGSGRTGLSIDSFSTVSNCSFIGNIGVNGSAMQAKGSHSLIIDCLFEDNTSSFLGGALTSSKVNTILRCTFKNNQAPGYGSGAAWTASSKFISCIFDGNSAGNGGVTWIESTSTTVPIFKNCLFKNNKASGHGGVFYAKSPVEIINCTFIGNQADSNDSGTGSGEAIHARDSIYVINSIFWDNENGIGSSPIVDIATPSSNISCSIVEGGHFGGTNIITAYPEFTDSAFGDYTLKRCSPAIDTGYQVSNSTSLDLAQNPRLHNAKGLATAKIDLGAYEFQMDYASNCCHDVLLLSGPLSSGTYEASNTITCSGFVDAGADVIFNAPIIVLRLSFEVIDTGVFETRDEGCGN